MKIFLYPTMHKYINRKVKSGAYPSADALIRAAIDRARQRHREIKSLRASMNKADKQIERGEGIPLSELTVAHIRERAIKRFGPHFPDEDTFLSEPMCV